jgi:bacteriorhodopsin
MLVQTAWISIIIQLITGGIDLYALLKLNVPEKIQKFKDLLKIELGVQTVEFLFYIWLVLNITKKKNITRFRYLDWFITTPIMLITLMIFYDKKSNSVKEFINSNKKEIGLVVTLNSFMLIFGFLGELNLITYNLGGIFGFIPFLMMFKIIYDKYVFDNKDKRIFYYFFIFWSLYGVAYFQRYELKNSIYNILDLFAKNGFGLFLVWILYKNRIKG